MQQPNWEAFYHITENNPPWPRLVRAVSLLRRIGEALDLGCGGGRDTRYLLAHGFAVTAVDAEVAALATLVDLPREGCVARNVMKKDRAKLPSFCCV